MKLYASIALLALLCSASIAADDNTLLTIVQMTCNGPAEFMPYAPWGGGIFAPLVVKLFDSFYGRLESRTQCMCPDASGFDLMFDPIIGLLNQFQDSPLTPDKCLTDHFTRNLLPFSFMKPQLPSSCSYSTYVNNGTCALSYDVPELDLSFKVALVKCPHSHLPSFSVHCVGNGCTFFTKTCNDNTDCAEGTTCVNAFDIPGNIDIANIPANLFKGLQEAHLYASTDVSPGCYQAGRGSNPATPDNDIATRIITYVSQMFGSTATSVTVPKFCANTFGFQMLMNGTHNGNVTMLPEFSPDAIKMVDTGVATTSCIAAQVKTANVQQLEYNFMSSWDGMIGSVNTFNSGPVVAPLPAPLSGDTMAPLAHFGCDGSISFGNNQFGARVNSKMIDTINFAANLFYDVEKCRLNPALTPIDFIRHFMHVNAGFWLSLVDGDYDAPLAGDNWDDMRTLLFENHNNRKRDLPPKLTNLPASCNMDRWIREQRCDVRFTGLHSLTLLDIDIGARVTQCPNSFLNSVDIVCIGTDCHNVFDGVIPCGQNSDCPQSMKCLDVYSTFISMYNTTVDKDHANMVFMSDNIDFLFGSRNALDTCTQIQKGADPANAYPSFTSSGACNGPDLYRKDMTQVILEVFGKKDATAIKTLNFCVMNENVMFGSYDFASWAKTLVTTSGNSVTLNAVSGGIIGDDGNVTPYTPPASGTPTPTPTGSAASSLTLSVLVSSLALVAAFFAGRV